LFADDECLPEVREYVLKGLEKLIEAYKDDNTLLKTYKDIKGEDSSSLQFIKDLHVTSLYVGGSRAKAKTEYFITFRPDYKMDLDLAGFIVVPGKLVTAICYPDQSIIKIENEFPHVTLMQGGWAPKFSNDLLQALCGKDGPLSKEYKKQFTPMDDFTYKMPVKIAKGQGTAFFVKIFLRLAVKAKVK